MTDVKYILVVEDDPILKNLLGHTFAGKYQTLYASDGAQGLAIYDQYKPSLVLTDLMMPGADGFGLIENLRKRTDEGRSVPIIVVSNLGQDADKQRALGLGANEYLVKAEMDVDQIAARIEKLLGASAIMNADASAVGAAAPAAPAAPASPAASGLPETEAPSSSSPVA